MANELVVRVYDVEFGDCTYVYVPDGTDGFHILIDCGNRRDNTKVLKRALDDLKANKTGPCLPPARNHSPSAPAANKWLDLLIVTHPDFDHISGFEPELFKDVSIGQIWLTPLLQDDHPQAKQSLALGELALSSAQALLERHALGVLTLDDYTLGLVKNQIKYSKSDNLTFLKKKLKPAHSLLYMCRDYAKRVPRSKWGGAEFKTEKDVTRLCGFKDADTKLYVLGPEWDIDNTYLAKQGYLELLESTTPTGHAHEKAVKPNGSTPTNISESDFAQLREGMQYSALAFARDNDFLQNNTSLVLLIEWKGRRLLFPGDAQWGTKRNSWDVMLKTAKPYLETPLDFLKVAHHGSINATPFTRGSATQPVLEKLVPKGKAQMIVSTKAGEYTGQNPVPSPELMEELGKRAKNARVYDDEPFKQPERTDQLGGQRFFFEFKFAPANSH